MTGRKNKPGAGRPPGRVLKITDEQLKLIGQLAGVGCNYDQISHILGIHPTTFDRMVAEDAKIYGAIEKGRASAGGKVLGSAYQMATSGKHPWMTAFWLKCKLGWKEDKSEVEGGSREFKLNYKD